MGSEIPSVSVDDDYNDEDHNGIDSDVEQPDHGEFSDEEGPSIFNPLPPSCFERPDNEEPESVTLKSNGYRLYSCRLLLKNISSKNFPIFFCNLRPLWSLNGKNYHEH